MHSFSLLLLLFTTLLSLPPLSTSSPGFHDYNEIDHWCKTTPHPEPCLYYLTHTRHADHPRQRADFYHLSVEVTLQVSIHAQNDLRRLGSENMTELQKRAWLDCWRLSANTIVQLNRSLDLASGGNTAVDAQTWLSAALTNLEMCRKGFDDLKESTVLMEPMMKYNISALISNCLAINNVSVPANLTGALPKWTAAAGRRLLQLSRRADIVVAKDGSGNFGTIKAALRAAAALMQSRRPGRVVIYVKSGVYNENVQIVSSLDNITMVGDGIGKTIITGSRSVKRGYTTFSSPTFSVLGDGFIASGITFRNTYGPGSQAVALLSGSDRSIFYKCSFEGYQDTLCVYTQRQFYRECDIYGTIDFIFGNAAVVLQNCNIFVRRPRNGEANVITAQGRTDPFQNTGIVIQFCTIKPASDLLPVSRTVNSYLGRPWQRYSRTVYLRNYIDSFINPVGWLAFNGNFGLNTLYYAEFRNTGPGSRMSLRVRWPGYHVIVRPSLVAQFTVANFIAGGAWIPAAGVPFASGL